MDLASFRPLTTADARRLQLATHDAPGPLRFWRSAAFLQSDSANVIGEVDGCLVVLRRKVLHGYPAAYLPFPPLGPTSAAQGVVDRFRALGIGTKMTALDAAQFGGKFVAQRDNIEYIYKGGEGIIKNRAGRDLRHGLNTLSRLTSGRTLTLIATGELTPYMAGCVECATAWYQQRKAARSTIKVVKNWPGVPNRWAHIILRGAKVVAFSLTEQIGARGAAFVVCIRDYSEPLSKNMMGALHALDCLHWGDEYSITAGSSVGVKGMDLYKRSLGESEQAQIYDMVLPRKLTIEDYRRLFVVPQTRGLLE